MNEMSSAPSQPTRQQPQQQSAPLEQEVMKIFLKNKAYKSMLITSETLAGQVCQMMAEKLNLSAHSNSFDLIDVQRDQGLFFFFFLPIFCWFFNFLFFILHHRT